MLIVIFTVISPGTIFTIAIILVRFLLDSIFVQIAVSSASQDMLSSSAINRASVMCPLKIRKALG